MHLCLLAFARPLCRRSLCRRCSQLCFRRGVPPRSSAQRPCLCVQLQSLLRFMMTCPRSPHSLSARRARTQCLCSQVPGPLWLNRPGPLWLKRARLSRLQCPCLSMRRRLAHPRRRPWRLHPCLSGLVRRKLGHRARPRRALVARGSWRGLLRRIATSLRVLPFAVAPVLGVLQWQQLLWSMGSSLTFPLLGQSLLRLSLVRLSRCFSGVMRQSAH